MVRIFVNNTAFYVKKDISVLEALSFLGLRIPRFCYHESLSIAGNCRICLVEIDSALKLVASCAQPILANMQIFSNTTKVLKTRENILESLLLNHPLDCPICDQAGECDLQDQSKIFGGIFSRHIFPKRGVENKIIDPCIKTIMTRCIHCTRCVRFASEIMGKPFLGTLNRGRFTEIGGYISHFQDNSEISGNVIDLCPVGALTAKPYAFKARPWELRSIENIDLTDGLGSNIYVNLKELDLISILPKNNPKINGQWISNKARFFIDAIQRYRISSAWVKDTQTKSSVQPLHIINQLVTNSSKKIFLVNSEMDFNTLRLLKKLEVTQPNTIKVYNISTQNKELNYYKGNGNRVYDVDSNESNCFILLASNPRTECAILNIKLRIKSQSKKLNSYSIGLRSESTFPTKFINITPFMLIALLEAKSIMFSRLLTEKLNPIFLIGEAFLKRVQCSFYNIEYTLQKYNSKSTILLLNKSSNTESLRLLNIQSFNTNVLHNAKAIYCCNLSNSLQLKSILDTTTSTVEKIWIHTHGSEMAASCQYILPSLSYFETEGVFINLERRPQKSTKLLENYSPNTIYSTYEMLQIFKTKLNLTFQNLTKANEEASFYYMDEMLNSSNLFDQLSTKFNSILNLKLKEIGYVSLYPYKPILSDFYRTNSYSMHSLNMTNYSNKKRATNNIFLNLIQ